MTTMNVTLHMTASKPVTYRGRNSGRVRAMTFSTYDVRVDGVLVGEVEKGWVTRETRSKGRTFVNTRWQSPGWSAQVNYVWAAQHDLPTGGRYINGLNSRKEALERLLHDALHTDWGLAEALAESAKVV